MGRGGVPTLAREEGVSLRDAGVRVALAIGALGLTLTLVDRIGAPAWLALPPLLWLSWKAEPDRPHDGGPRVTGAPGVAETSWLEDAYASRQRGTHLSTLAVRYDVEPEWLAAELDKLGRAGA